MNARVLKAPSVALEGEEHPESASFKDALADAFEQGRVHGASEATAQLEGHVEALRETLIETAHATQEAVVDSVRIDAEAMVALAADLAEWALDGVVSADPSLLTGSLHAALRVMADETSMILHVHPDVAATLGSDDSVPIDTVRTDPAMGRADFRLVADGSMVERNVRAAIGELAPELAAAFRGQSQDG